MLGCSHVAEHARIGELLRKRVARRVSSAEHNASCYFNHNIWEHEGRDALGVARGDRLIRRDSLRADVCHRIRHGNSSDAVSAAKREQKTSDGEERARNYDQHDRRLLL